MFPEFEYFKCILENRNLFFSSKIRRSKITDYAALSNAKLHVSHV